jgi:hypothetical protein
MVLTHPPYAKTMGQFLSNPSRESCRSYRRCYADSLRVLPVAQGGFSILIYGDNDRLDMVVGLHLRSAQKEHGPVVGAMRGAMRRVPCRATDQRVLAT